MSPLMVCFPSSFEQCLILLLSTYRGGKNNQHSGNEKLRQYAKEEGANYRCSTKKGKSAISRDLVQKMRDLNPSARFLKRNVSTGEWEDVGDEVAREKASQVLRDAVALLSDENPGGENQVDDEPIPVGFTTEISLSASVTHDEMDRKPPAVMMGPHQQAGSDDIPSSFPPSSPMNNARKRRRHSYYTSEHLAYSNHPYQHGPPPHLAHPQYRDFAPHRQSSRRYTEPFHSYQEQLAGDPTLSPTRRRIERIPYHYYQYGTPAFQHPIINQSGSGDMNPPAPRPDYYSRPQRYHEQLSSNVASAVDFFPPAPAPTMQSPRPYLNHGVGPEPNWSSAPVFQHRTAAPQHTYGSVLDTATSHHNEYSQWSSPSIPRASAPSGIYRQNASTIQQSPGSLLGDMNEGINEFDLFHGELIDSDLESSPRYPRQGQRLHRQQPTSSQRESHQRHEISQRPHKTEGSPARR